MPVSKCPFRSPKAVSEAICGIISEKIVCELGSAHGDNLEFMAEYAAKVKGVEFDHDKAVVSAERGFDIIEGNYFDTLPEADVYYCWPDNPRNNSSLYIHVKSLYPSSTLIICGDAAAPKNEIRPLRKLYDKYGGKLIGVEYNEGDGHRENGTLLLWIV